MSVTSYQFEKNNFQDQLSVDIQKAETLVEVLCYRAQKQPQQKAFIWLQDGEREADSLTYQELDRRAKQLAAKLQGLALGGERALLLYPPGLEFIVAFFGCLYAGVIAVPLYPPKRNQKLARLAAVVSNSTAKIALTNQAVIDNIDQKFSEAEDLKNLAWLVTDQSLDSSETQWQMPAINGQSLAFLQYTSGSTGIPKGVMVSHENLLYNERMIEQAFGHDSSTIAVGWLPLFHDMGLIGNVIQPLYLGASCILMSPIDLLQKPLRWLSAISQYKATSSGGPNFAYELCTQKITEKQKAQLDLSSWQVAFSGAEPVRAETMNKFSQIFASCGFKAQAFYPCYGLAEATLLVSGGKPGQLPILETRENPSLENHQKENISSKKSVLVGCGQAWLDEKIAIVNPESLQLCQEGKVGEIWVQGRNVAQGYWGNEQQTKQVFQAYLSDTGTGPFLRTGDLGFLKNNQLFITGRLKDLIVIRGLNHYPQDIELTVENTHPALRPHSSAAFSVEVAGEEKLVVVAEVERRYMTRRRQSDCETYQGQEKRETNDRRQTSVEPELESKNSQALDVAEVALAVRQAISEHHNLELYALSLIRVGSIPKTSSGKIQRYLCREQFLKKNLTIIGQWQLETNQSYNHQLPEPSFNEQFLQKLKQASHEERVRLLQVYLLEKVALALQLAPSQLQEHLSFNQMGFDSLKVMELSNQVQVELGISISLEKLMENLSIISLSNYLSEQLAQTDSHTALTIKPVDRKSRRIKSSLVNNIGNNQLD